MSSSSDSLSITVVVCTLNRPEELESCLQSISRLRYPELQLLVVENGPPDGKTRGVAARHGARYLHSPQLGLSRARNHGARACLTDLVAFTDDDARPHPGWLEALAREFVDPAVMAVAGEIFPFPPAPSSASPSAGASAEPVSPPPQRGRRRAVDLETPDWFSATNFGGIGDGSNMCFRRAVFEQWPGFDQRLGRGAPLDSAEEHFAFFQLVLAGHRCVHTPEAIVWHRLPQTPAEWRRYNLRNLTNAVAYVALLWSEYPQTRRLLFEHLWKRNSGERRRQRAASPAPGLSWPDKLRVVIRGLLLFLKLPRAGNDRQPEAVRLPNPNQKTSPSPDSPGNSLQK